MYFNRALVSLHFSIVVEIVIERRYKFNKNMYFTCYLLDSCTGWCNIYNIYTLYLHTLRWAIDERWIYFQYKEHHTIFHDPNGMVLHFVSYAWQMRSVEEHLTFEVILYLPQPTNSTCSFSFFIFLPIFAVCFPFAFAAHIHTNQQAILLMKWAHIKRAKERQTMAAAAVAARKKNSTTTHNFWFH